MQKLVTLTNTIFTCNLDKLLNVCKRLICFSVMLHSLSQIQMLTLREM